MQQTHILLVEDNEGDIVLTLETFHDLLLTNLVSVVRDGEEAIRYLNKQDAFINAKTPDLIFLDINLPKINGKELLNYLQADVRLKDIPVIMLTTSASQTDMNECMAKNASCYLTKPLDVSSFLKAAASIINLRLTLCSHQKNTNGL